MTDDEKDDDSKNEEDLKSDGDDDSKNDGNDSENMDESDSEIEMDEDLKREEELKKSILNIMSSPFAIWRISFYLLMVYSEYGQYLGPFGSPPGEINWIDAMSYDHAEFIYDMAPKTDGEVFRLRCLRMGLALLSAFWNPPTILFALLKGQHMFTSMVMFINHDYLFFLIATLMAFCLNCEFDGIQNRTHVHSHDHAKAGWIHALRGQIVVVYFFASLWKLDADWINGTIVGHIFLSFEEQGDARGIPWKQLQQDIPHLFLMIGIGGLLLDFTLFCVLCFLPPGHKLQRLGFLFHGFTGYTMSERIGYSFPSAMILAGLLFLPQKVIDTDQVAIGGDTLSHAQWTLLQLRGWWPSTVTAAVKDVDTANDDTANVDTANAASEGAGVIVKQRRQQMKRNYLPMLFLFFQWMIPLRMPIVSNGEYKYTFEGYRWSWTMMLHSKSSLHGPGVTFTAIRPKCLGTPFPNAKALENGFLDIQGYPYELDLVHMIRSSTVFQMFARQMPKMAHKVHGVTGPMCLHPMTYTASFFSSTNEGPYHRIIDPTSDLLKAYEAHAELSWPSKLWYAMLDKAVEGHEFILRGTGSIDPATTPLLSSSNIAKRAMAKEEGNGELMLVDRSSCLQVDPIRIHSNQFYIEFDHSYANVDTDFGLVLTGCPNQDLTEGCATLHLKKGEKKLLTPMRTVLIGIDPKLKLGQECSTTTKEDVVIKLTEIQQRR